MDIICFSKLTVFLELRSRTTVHFSDEIMSVDKYRSIFSCHMEAIVHMYGGTFLSYHRALGFVTL